MKGAKWKGVFLIIPVEISLTLFSLFPHSFFLRCILFLLPLDNKKEPHPRKGRLFPHPLHLSSPVSHLYRHLWCTYIIMKNKDFFNPHFYDQLQDISSDYDKQARTFQKEYNFKHPGMHIWRHILYRKTFRFFLSGQMISVDVEIVRFIYAGTNRTFTFYGSFFLPFFHFTKEFMCQAVRSPDTLPALEVSAETIRRWARLSCIFSTDMCMDTKLHNPSHGNTHVTA